MGFERIVAGVDGSEESLEALRLARRLAAPDARIVAVTVRDLAVAAQAGYAAGIAADQLSADADEAHESARAELAGVPGADARIVDGRPFPTLLAALEQEDADLLALGPHGRSRAAGILFGSVATRMLHDSPVSVLVARPGAGDGFPARVVAGVDGSPESLAAARVAAELAERSGGTLRLVAAAGGKPLDEDELARLDGVERDERRPLDVLLEAAETADLVVVGARGLHGPRALGSVSERLAHRADCSVLVVRAPRP